MTKAILQLGALTCPSCLQKIQGALEKQAGVEKVKVLFNASKAKIDFDETVNNADALAEVVTKLGYEVKSIKVKEPAK
ncbi:heavy-metal-associated domain-containing protein [Pediococcus inopinatus]|uniref:heavy-metal-associated domain-containing protein n=1 Tax=Pediococcus inopinatus TaxID=114090 RepID=UPI00070FCAB6|nr:heavy metal-associated domain-containing protein [Pediococcus inopinatus]AVK99683.1 heavy metal-binding protein [Pediococcus inopinatus]KRN61351.1 hypothetical protein IV83_GL000917 [Pediococcus inopinatus]WPC17409.1 heavy-metal-associated domain-containing protein [Pediococcus inopinatus]